MIDPNWIWGIFEIVLLTALVMSGVHVFISVGVVSIVFAVLYYGDLSGINLVGTTILNRTFTYEMSMVPLFILMGAWVEVAGLGKDAYDACMKWLSRLKGSLAYITTASNALFSAVSGMALAGVATIGSIALPEMKRYGYSAKLRTGVVSGGTLLSSLIPPSAVAVIYSLFTDESLGQLFMSGVIPGIIMVVLFIAIIYIWVTLRPSAAPMLPREVHFTWGERFRAIGGVGPIAVIFLFMMGGIYLGWFSPTEAAGMGAFGVLAVTLVLRRMSWHNFNEALNSTLRLSAYTFFILGGAFVFSHTLAITKLGTGIGNLIAGTGLNRVVIMYIIAIIVIIAGTALDMFPMTVLFIPVFYPLVISLGFSGIWFGCLWMLLMDLAMVTPPLAGPLYLTQLIDGCSTKDVMLGVIPFYTACFIVVVLMIQFPAIVLWLPTKMVGG
ncbi:MAG: TRAP transporter large permease [Chloroflexota bacterium]